MEFNFYQYKVTQYNSLNVKLSNSQLNKWKSTIKNESEVVLRLLSNMIGNNETNFPHELLLTNRKFSNLHKDFTNNSSTNIKLSKEQNGGFLSMLLGKLGASLLGNLLTGWGINRAGEGVIRAGYGNKMDF